MHKKSSGAMEVGARLLFGGGKRYGGALDLSYCASVNVHGFFVLSCAWANL